MFLGMFQTPVAINHIQYSIFQQYISGHFFYATEKAEFPEGKRDTKEDVGRPGRGGGRGVNAAEVQAMSFS